MDEKMNNNSYNETVMESFVFEDETMEGIPGVIPLLKDNDSITENELQKILKKMEKRDRKLAEDIIKVLLKRDEKELKAKSKEEDRLSNLDFYGRNEKKEARITARRIKKDEKEETEAIKKLARILDKYDSKRCKQ